MSIQQIPDDLLEGFDDDADPDFDLGALENVDSDKESDGDDDEGESMMLVADFLIEEEDAGAESSDDDADLGPLMRLGAVMRDRAAGLVPEPEPEPEDDLDDDDASGFAALCFFSSLDLIYYVNTCSCRRNVPPLPRRSTYKGYRQYPWKNWQKIAECFGKKKTELFFRLTFLRPEVWPRQGPDLCF